MSENSGRLVGLTAQIVSTYLAANAVAADALPGLIRGIHQSLADLERTAPEREEIPPPASKSAVDARKSVFADHLVCLACGASVMMLKRHLRVSHEMTPEQYRTKWGLPATYPMVTPDYAKVRSKLAKESGLGRKGR